MMILHPEPELLEFADEVRKLATGAPASDMRARWDSPDAVDSRVWRTLVQDMGAATLGTDPADADAPFLAQALVFEQLGYALDDSPYFATVALAQSMLVCARTPAASEILGRLQSGAATASAAIADPDGRWHPMTTRTSATQTANGWRVDGTKSYVVDAGAADVLIVTAETSDGLALFAVDANNAVIEPIRSVDLTRWTGTATFADAPAQLVSSTDSRAELANGLARAGTLLAAELVGVSQRCLDMAVEYAKIRTQSGRTIGSFQAIKHKCADMLLAVETARATVYFAARSMDERPDQFVSAAAVAQSIAIESAQLTASENIQIHGGIGFTWEHDAHLFYRRANASAALLGSPAFHRAELLTRIISGGSHA